MNVLTLRRRVANIPPWHWLIALLIGGAAATAAYQGWKQLPTDYLGLSLLSYENPKQFLADQAPAEPSTTEIADSILTPKVLDAIALRTSFIADGDIGVAGVESNSGQGLRAQMELEQPGSGLLQISLHGRNPKAVVQAVNAVSSALSAWHAPAPLPSHIPSKVVAELVKALAAQPKSAANGSMAAMEFQEQLMSTRIEELSAEEQLLEANPAATGEVGDPDAVHRAQLLGRITAAKRKVEDLQQDDTDDAEIAAAERSLSGLRRQYALLLPLQVGASRAEQLAAIVKLLAQLRLQRGTLADQIDVVRNQHAARTPTSGADAVGSTVAVSPGPDKDPANDAPAAQNPGGSFSVVTWSDGPHVMPNPQSTLLLWGGMAASFLLALGYIACIYRRYRPVRDAAGMMKAVPADALFLGVVSCGRIGGDAR